jgi:DNA mismatch repair protein MSH5
MRGQYSTHVTCHYQLEGHTDLDIHIGDLHSTIVDREIEIIQELLNDVILSSEAITRACETCAELDCLLSFAAASRAYNYVRPVMVDENVIDIKQGRYCPIVFPEYLYHFNYHQTSASRTGCGYICT